MPGSPSCGPPTGSLRSQTRRVRRSFIDDASHTTPPRARSCIDAFLTVYWAAMGKPEAARTSSQNLAWDQLPDVVARGQPGRSPSRPADAGRTTEAIAAAHTDTPWRAAPSTLRTCGSSLPTPHRRTAAVRSDRGSLGVGRAAAPANGRSPREALSCSAPPWRVEPPLLPAASTPRVPCWNRWLSC